MAQSVQTSAFGYTQPGNINNVVSATSNTTLTSTRTLLVATPTNFGMKVTLPSATTMTASAFVHAIDNRSDYSIRVHNFLDNLIGFVPPRTYSPIGLIDNSTSAGTWEIVNGERIGISAQLNSTLITNLADRAATAVDMGSNIEVVYGYRTSDGYLTAVAFNRDTATFGTPVVVRSANVAGGGNITAAAIKHSSTQVLMISCTYTSTAMEAVIVSVNTSTLALTVNTAATATLAGNITNFVIGSALVALPSLADSFVTSYLRSTSVAGIRAISVSGTTVTIGAETALDGTLGGNLVTSGDKVIAASRTTTVVYTKPYTISGSTITAGTGTSATLTGTAIDFFFPLGTRWALFYNDLAATQYAGIVTLSGTTTTISVASQSSANPSDCIVLGSDKVVFGETNTINILTDSSGTAFLGTALSHTVGARRMLFTSGNNVMCISNTNTPTALYDCSGSSPVLSKVVSNTSNTLVAGFSAHDASLNRPANAFYASAYAASLSASGTSVPFYGEVGLGGVTPKLPSFIGYSGTIRRGRNNLERWWPNTVDLVAKVECAA